MMTLEEAIKILKQYQGYDPMFPDGETLKHAFDLTDETVDTLLTALRPVSREQVEKVWRGEWRLFDDCANEGLYCSQCGKKVYRVEYANVKMATRFCPNCMSAMTDEAVEMVMERINKMEETGNGLG